MPYGLAAYVFTNSFCATCPEVFELLNQTVQGTGQAGLLQYSRPFRGIADHRAP